MADRISYESNCLDIETIKALEHKAHNLMPGKALGSVNAIRITPDNRLEGAADRRGDNSACGY